jgi:hypothetical protein
METLSIRETHQVICLEDVSTLQSQRKTANPHESSSSRVPMDSGRTVHDPPAAVDNQDHLPVVSGTSTAGPVVHAC